MQEPAHPWSFHHFHPWLLPSIHLTSTGEQQEASIFPEKGQEKADLCLNGLHGYQHSREAVAYPRGLGQGLVLQCRLRRLWIEGGH